MNFWETPKAHQIDVWPHRCRANASVMPKRSLAQAKIALKNSVRGRLSKNRVSWSVHSKVVNLVRVQFYWFCAKVISSFGDLIFLHGIRMRKEPTVKILIRITHGNFWKKKISKVRKILYNWAVGSGNTWYALRVARAETRLTVYRPLQVSMLKE